ncbi:hypothetical protein O5478_17705 [Escherichia coli]|nr:hypothetical protein [Escherichia coli]
MKSVSAHVLRAPERWGWERGAAIPAAFSYAGAPYLRSLRGGDGATVGMAVIGGVNRRRRLALVFRSLAAPLI